MSGVPFDPNGMAMDLLRSCYSGQIEYAPGLFAPAVWYWCAPTALPFPEPHLFGSPTWDTVHPTVTSLGWNALAPRKYYNGRRLNASQGRDFAGPLAYFSEGAPSSGNLPRIADGYTPTVCVAPAGKMLGGLSVPSVPSAGTKKLSGKSIQPITPGIPCGFCSGTTPLQRTVVIAGATGAASPANGTWVCTQLSFNPCFWLAGGLPGVQILAQKSAANIIGVTAQVGFLSSQIYQLTGPSDCISLSTLPKFSTVNPDWPATISIQ